jgi:hypothetical protein
MIGQIEDTLIKNSKEYYEEGLSSYKRKRFNTSLTLFFKSIAVLSDLFIYRREGKVPSNHSERFRILGEKYIDIYNLLDKDFPFYQSSYRLEINKETCEVIKKDAEYLFEILGIPL